MRRRVTRWIAAIMIGTMLVSSTQVGTLKAEDNNKVATEKNNQLEAPQDSQSLSDSGENNTEDGMLPEIPDTNVDGNSDANSEKTEITNTETPEDGQNPENSELSEDITETETEDEGTVEEADEIEAALNYLYINEAEQEEGAVQNIVLSWGETDNNVKSASIVVENESGKVIMLEAINRIGETFLYEYTFVKGLYHVSKVNIETDTSAREFTMEELGISANFGVGQSSNEAQKSAYMEMESVNSSEESEIEVGTSVVSIDENGEATAQNSIASAMASQGVEKPSNNMRMRSAKASNVVVVLDPGHDATHAGARGNGVAEEVAVLKIAQYCKAELEQYSGVTVYMTRTGAACPFPNSTSNIDDIYKRTAWAKTKGANVFVSFHLNSSSSSSPSGAEVYYPASSSAGKVLAQQIQSQLVALGLYNRGATANASYAVVNSSMNNGFPGLIIEHAFLSNSSDANTYLKSDASLKRLGVADATGIANYFGLSKGQWIQDGDKWKYKVNGNYVISQWMMIGGKKYYFDENGYRLTGWQTIGGKRYYFMPEGEVLTGWAWFGQNKYYFMPEGEMLTGWVWFGQNKYYFLENGIMAKGEKVIDNQPYLFSEQGILQCGWQNIAGKKYFFQTDGSVLTGWAWFGQKKYYFDKTGAMLTGTHTIDGEEYTFDKNGVLSKIGWIVEGGKRYYYDEKGNQLLGWQEIGGETYYFNQSLKGAALTGWTWFGSKKYYFTPEGKMVTNWIWFGSNKYYFGTNGVMRTGWQEIDGSKYYFGTDGKMLTGWAWFGQKKYYFDKTGAMLTGTHTIDGEEYTFDKNGVLSKIGWIIEGGKRYYYDEKGNQLLGWQEIGGETYYFNQSLKGAALTGWAWFGSKKYYFTPEGKMVTNWIWFGSNKYYFGTNGVMRTGWQDIDGSRYYFGTDGKMLTGWAWFGQKKYYFASDGRMLTSWQTINGNKYFFYEDGRMLTGWAWFGNNRYYFDANGKAAEGWVKIDGLWCFFDENNIYDKDAVMDGDMQAAYEIQGNTTVTVDMMIHWFKKHATYPSFYNTTDAKTIEEFCKIYMEEARAEGIKAEVAFAQAMLETGWLKFGGDVKISQFNFAGIGTVGGGVAGATFHNVREGIRAQIQHLKAYAGTTTLNNPCVDPRFHLVKRGSAKYVEWLGIQENPYGTGWASAPQYGYKIINLIKDMKNL